jgi:Kef-type K+ transport system membrane component KefB
MREATKSSLFVAIGGLLFPFILGCGLGYYFIPENSFKVAQVMFIGTAVAITAVPIAVRVLMDVDKLDSKIGRCIVSAAVIDDVLSLMLLAVLTGMVKSGEIPSLGNISVLFFKVCFFFALCWVLGRYVFPFISKLLKKGSVQEGGFGGLLIMAFAFALLAELLALHFIIGAFFAGLLFQARDVGTKMFKEIEGRISGITAGFLAPIFFASIGLHVTFGAVIETPVFTFSLLALAIIGKVLGAGIPAYLQHRNVREAAIIGSAMNGRGAVELVILEIALRANLFDHPQPAPPVIEHMFSAIVVMAIVTTIMTPVMIKALLKK